MQSIKTCREILLAAGSGPLDDADVEALRDFLVVVARLQLRQEFGVDVAR